MGQVTFDRELPSDCEDCPADGEETDEADVTNEDILPNTEILGAKVLPNKNTGPVVSDFGRRIYELKNHLGNVMVTFSENITTAYEKTSTADRVEYTIPEIITAADYLPFGLAMNRDPDSRSGKNYRYGFNGKEKDDDGEWGDLTQYDYGFRIYNPGIARFLSVDPLMKIYPMLTPYQFASNRPIDGIDLDGLEYFDSDEAMINMTFGGASLKLSHVSNSTANYYRQSGLNIDTENNTIGMNASLSISDATSIKAIVKEIKVARNGFAGPITRQELKLNLHLWNKTKFSGNSAQRRKQRKARERRRNTGPLAKSPSAGRAAGAAAAVRALLLISEKAHEYKINNDYEVGLDQFLDQGLMSTIIVEDNLDIIPAELQTDQGKAILTNFIFQGVIELPNNMNESLYNSVFETGVKIILRDERVSLSN
ncbi:RHS repeat domain-containing protein [Neolewinella antarctica]|uniref:RHS repeat-associated protein n=1 Tax=Neolewinella antarctica TaxID=442734 RepID=A0ABX0XCG5_9BACT|nr:RHS repeat-associated core domain-containing protein [Neolewinella antarctica]NJC26609.1 RHS repeat-associated protein [Neolewinella antarctica]